MPNFLDSYRAQPPQPLTQLGMVGESPALNETLELAHKAARSDANILLCGESGTGKELAAQAIHINSPRAAHPFVAVDCASLPESLLEAELFGHEKGAFTGAIGKKPGLMESAHRGTLFLDEVGEMPISLQARCCARFRKRSIAGSVVRKLFNSICACSLPPVAICTSGSERENSDGIFFSGLM